MSIDRKTCTLFDLTSSGVVESTVSMLVSRKADDSRDEAEMGDESEWIHINVGEEKVGQTIIHSDPFVLVPPRYERWLLNHETHLKIVQELKHVVEGGKNSKLYYDTVQVILRALKLIRNYKSLWVRKRHHSLGCPCCQGEERYDFQGLLSHAENSQEAGLDHHVLWMYLREVEQYLFSVGKHSVPKIEHVHSSGNDTDMIIDLTSDD